MSSPPPGSPTKLLPLLWRLTYQTVVGLGIAAFIYFARPACIYLSNRPRWALSQAASEGDLPAVRTLVFAGVDLDTSPLDWNSGEYGLPALTTAALAGQEKVVRYLLEQGAKVNRKGMSNPLAAACWQHHLAVAQLLLEHGADPNIRSGEGKPLEVAEGTGQEELAALLRRYGARERIQ